MVYFRGRKNMDLNSNASRLNTVICLKRTLQLLDGVESLRMVGTVDYARVGLDQDDDEEFLARWKTPARLSDDVFQQLTPDVDHSAPLCLCPKLVEFECTTGQLDVNVRELLEFIISRRTVNEESGSGVRRLKRVAVTLSRPTTLDFKDELDKKGVEVDAFDFKAVYVREG